MRATADERGDRDVAAGPADPVEAEGSRRRSALVIPLPRGWPRVEAGTAWRVLVGAGRGERLGARAGAGAAGAASLEIADRRRTRRGVPGATRRRAGDDREVALAAGKGRRRLRRAASRRGPLGGDRRLADRAFTRLPVRRNPGTPPGTRASGRLGNDRRQPGEARRGQSVAATPGAAPVRVLGRTRCHRRASRARHRAMVIFAAATGLRPAEWLALEWRDIDLEARVVYVHRSFTKGRLKCPKTEASRRAVPLQTIGIEAIERLPPHPHSPLLFPAERGGYLDLHNFRNREWKPAQLAAGIEPLRRVYDLRHTFATFALRAGISTFDLSRYMGASLTMIDRHYGHLARDGREHAIRLLDELSAGQRPRWTLVDAARTPNSAPAAGSD